MPIGFNIHWNCPCVRGITKTVQWTGTTLSLLHHSCDNDMIMIMIFYFHQRWWRLGKKAEASQLDKFPWQVFLTSLTGECCHLVTLITFFAYLMHFSIYLRRSFDSVDSFRDMFTWMIAGPFGQSQIISIYNVWCESRLNARNPLKGDQWVFLNFFVFNSIPLHLQHVKLWKRVLRFRKA